jgi:MFS family permease
VVSPRLLVRWGGKPVLLVGLSLIAIGLTLLARIPTNAEVLLDVLPAMMVMGAGGGLTLPALASLGMSAATDSNSGLASGLLNTTQQVGGALGLAVLTSLAAARTAGATQSGSSTAAALTDGYRLGFAVGASIVVTAFILAAVALRSGPDHRHRVADEDESATRGQRRSAPRPQ